MKNNNSNTENYLMKIYDQNNRILELLEKFLESKGNDKSLDLRIDDEKNADIDKVNALTDRERQVIQLLIAGKMNKQIAYDLTISISTVEYHRSNIMKKLNAKNIGQMIKMYLLWEDSL